MDQVKNNKESVEVCKVDRLNAYIINTLKELKDTRMTIKDYVAIAQRYMVEMDLKLEDHYVLPQEHKPYIVQRKNAAKATTT